MSSEFTDVARIQDEEVLRRMWQETDDFGRKKEIRAHMYKVRENRLKEFYNTGEVSSEIQKTTTTTTRSSNDTSSKTNMSTTYADDLADQSYVKLKSKEVRDSESPIRDNYNRSIDKRQDQGWTITSSNERSDDGKTFSTTHSATRAGTENINGGKLDYSARLDEKSSVFQDGDDKNFTKAVGSSSSSIVRQEATGGDENSAFKSSTTKTSSSSKYVSESRNTSEDIRALPSTNVIVTNEQVPYTINEDNIRSISEKTFTTDAPSDLKKHPNYIEGKTKITQETKTLADGTVVTTTRYVTKDGNSTSTATHKKYSNIGSTKTERRSSSSTAQTQTRSNVVNDTKKSTTRDDRRPVEYVIEPGKTVDIKVDTVKQSRDHTDNTNVNERFSNQHTTKIVRESTQTKKNDTSHLQDTRKIDNKTIDVITVPTDSTTTTIKTTRTIITEEIPCEQTDVTYHTTKTHQINQKKDIVDKKKIVNDEFITTERQQEINTRDVIETPNKSREQPQRKPQPIQESYQSPVQPKTTHDIPYDQPQRKPQMIQEPYQAPGTQDIPYEQPQRKSQPIQEPQRTPYEEPQGKRQPNEEPYQIPVQRKVPSETSYEQPERRQPIKPGKSEIEKLQPIEGQYDTTYRTEYTSKRISVEVSPTHDAFARSLRSVTPERNTRSGRNTPRTGSNTSLRSSPEKMRFPSRTSPDRGRSTSPKKPNDKCSSTETITYKTTKTSKYSPDGKHPTGKKPTNDVTKKPKTTEHYSSDTITRRSRTETTTTENTDTNTLTRNKNRPRSPSPTSTTTSDFEYVRNDTDDSSSVTTTTTTNKKTTATTRPDSLEITRKTKKITDRSPTSPLTDLKKSPTKPNQEKPKTIRTDTYEERVKEILGLKQDKQEIRRSSLERNSLKKTSVKEVSTRTFSDDVVNRLSVTKAPTTPKYTTDKRSPERKSPEKNTDNTPTRKTPTKPTKKENYEPYPEKKSPTKCGPTVSEFPSQIRKSPQREPLEPYPEKKSPTKSGPTVNEFPSQIRRSPQREPLEPYPEKKSPTKSAPTVSEFPSQIGRSPEREPLEPYPERRSPTKSKPSVDEFPSQIRRSPEKEPLEPYPEKKSPIKCGPSVNEFPSQIRRSPEKEPLEPYPEQKSPTKSAPTVSEFPSQIRKSPEREPLEPYPERKYPTKSKPSVDEFPSQIRRSPEKEPLEPYPERKSPTKSKPSVNEFPSQLRRSPEKEPLEPYPETKLPNKSAPTVSEFPSQIRRSPEREPLEPYPERKSPIKSKPTVNEFPSQIRRSPEREPLEPYTEKKYPTKSGPTVNEFPSQIRKSPQKEPMEPYPEKKSPSKSGPTVCEFPSQIRKSPEREPLESYPEQKYPKKSAPKVNEFPSQVRRSPEREPQEPYPEKKSPTKSGPTVCEFPSQIRKSPEKEPLDKYPEKKSPVKYGPNVSEFPSQVRKTPQKKTLEPYPEKKSPTKSTPSSVGEFPSQVKKVPEKQPCEPYPEKKSPVKSRPTVDEFPSQSKKNPQKEPVEPSSARKSPTKSKPVVSELPSQVKKTPRKEPVETYPETKTTTKYEKTVSDISYQELTKNKKIPQRLQPVPGSKQPSKLEPTNQIRKSPERMTPKKIKKEKTTSDDDTTEDEEETEDIVSEITEDYDENYQRRTTNEIQQDQIITTDKKKSTTEILEIERNSNNMSKKPRNKSPGEKQPIKPRDAPSSDDEIHETIREKHINTIETRIPIEEPVVERKLFSQLCREDEITRVDKKKTTQDFLESQIVEHTRTVQPKEQSPTRGSPERIVGKDLFSIKTDKKPIRQSQKPRTKSESSTSDEEIRTLQENLIVETSDVKNENIKKFQKTNKNVVNTVESKTTTTLRKDKTIPKDKKPSTKTTTEIIRTTITRKDSPKDKPAVKKPTQTSVKKMIETISTTTKLVKKPVQPKTVYSPQTIKKQPQTIYRVEKTKFIGESEYQDQFSKVNKVRKEPVRKTTKPVKTTLHDIEKENLKEDKTHHIRTNRVDDIVTKKKVTKTIMLNGDTPKSKTRDLPSRLTPKKSPISYPTEKVPESKPKTPTTTRYSTTVRKTVTDTRSTKPTVTTTITVTPKTKPSTKTPQSKTPTKKPKRKPTNDYASSDTDDESLVESVEGSFTEFRQNKNEFSRTTDETFTKRIREQLPREHVITTKTVLINHDDIPDREIIVNLQRSKSSREPTPDRLCPRLLTSDEEEDSSPVRYPDEIVEPDDGSLRRKPKKLSDIPIFESQDTQEFTRITEITDRRQKITEVDRVEETDQSLLSIDKKINKFMDTADKFTKEPIKSKPVSGDRTQIIEISDDLESDECLLSVSDKVNKFITTAEQLTSQKIPEKPKTPKTNLSIQRKVEEFETSVEESNKPKKPAGPAPKVGRPDLTEVDDELREDECLLSVSDKVSKFITTAEHLTNAVTKPISLSKIDMQPEQDEPSEVDRRSPNREPQYERQQTYTRKSTSLSPERDSPSPRQRSPLNTRPSLIPRHTPDRTTGVTKSEITETTYIIEDTSMPSSRRSPPTDDSKTVLSTTSRLRNTESIKKAKALFENIAKEQDRPKQRDILSRASVFEGKTTKKTDETKSSIEIEDREEITRRSSIKKSDKDLQSTKLVEEITRRSQSPQKSPERPVDHDRHKSPEKIEIARFRSSSPEKIPEIITYTPRSREPSPDGDIPHYMKPLDRSLRPNSPHRDSISQLKTQPSQPQDHTDSRPTRFGVTLKRTDSDKVTKTTDSSTIEKRRISVDKKVTEEEIDEIFDLEILEELLEIVVSYEIRRKIRTQIRLVKKLISEGTLETYILKRKSVVRRGSSPLKFVRPEEPRMSSPEKIYEYTDTVNRRRPSVEQSEYQSSYSKSERRYSSESTDVTRKSPSPVRERSSPQRLSPERKVTKSVDVNPTGKTTTIKTTESIPGGVKVTTTTTTETKSFTTLKKTVPDSKKPVEDNQPEWVKQRNLRNTKETNTKKVTSGTNTVSKKTSSRSSPSKEVKPTDIITSSYGVGPTDENGTPLFGLKALRAQNKNTTTKVQGTVVSSEYYSENGQEPVGQISVTKYSTDPRDLEEEGMITTDGQVTSVTTTQKFGYKDTPSLKNQTGSKKTKEICDKNETTTTKTTKVNRRGSVKAISQKFIENAVETLKSERQTTYPKAGLILRTSSFKSNEDPHSREGSPVEVTEQTTTTSSKTGETFLSNTNKITGVQDVITRMKTEEHQEGDTEEDIAARGLLNKFIGSQVLLSGMEAHARSTKSQTTVSSSPSGTVKRSTKITSTVTEGGKPRTTTKVFQRPVSEKDLETVWDEQTLKLLLEQSSDYEERRVIRARLRQVMAEQEACTALVDHATKGEDPATPTTPTPGQLEGESQLLPLLKGLLDAPENDITPDSGTESGEDQRSNLIAEVQTALEKLSTSLLNDQTDISEERRSNLLQLVAKLQAGLSGNDRRSSTSSSSDRFQKRKSKQSRHTVGVSKEELADARKLIEQISLNELGTSVSSSKVSLSKQNSESSVPTSSASSSYRSIHQARVKNATARPFSSSNSTSSSVQTPTEHFEGFDTLFNENKDKDITYHEAPTVQQKATPSYSTTVRQSSQTKLDKDISNDSTDSIKSAFKAVQQAAASKVSAMKQEQKDESDSEEIEEEEIEEEEEDDSSTVKTTTTVENAPLTSNPIYSKPVQKYDERCSRFDTQKRLKMKRANTIDIPKPLNFYQDDDDSDSDHEDGNQKRRDSSYALKGPVGVGDPNTKKIVPVFKPKTESDKKFLAFINKHNESSSNKNSPWARNSSVWGSKFGNIKSNFENPQGGDAKSFWKSADDNITRSNSNQFGPKISRESARNLQQMFEEKRKESQKYQNPVYSAGPVHQANIVTGSLQVKTEKEKQYKVIPQPLPMNQFSHAPQSAFKPIRKVSQPVSNRSSIVLSPENGELIKSEIKDPTGSAFLYSPKPLTSPVEKMTVTSPVGSKPWAANSTGSRVISLAASKFEHPPTKEPPRPIKMNRESNQALVNSYQAHTNIVDRAPSYKNKSCDNKSSRVRKLSDQYENLESKSSEAQQKPQTYQIRTNVVESQYTPQVKLPPQNIASSQQFTLQQDILSSPQQNTSFIPSQNTQYSAQNTQYLPQHPLQNSQFSQNYNIRYDQPQNYSIRYDQPQTQNYSIRYDKPQNHSIRYDQQPQQNIPQNYIVYNQPQTAPNQNYQPQNYRIIYDRPQNLPQNYSVKYDQPQSTVQSPQTPTRPQSSSPHDQVNQIQTKISPSSPANNVQALSPSESSPKANNEFTSKFVFKPTQNQKVPIQAIEPVVQPPKAERQISNESLHEHSAVSSRVMTGPVSQQAVTVKQKSPMSRDQHDMEAAFNLKSSLQKLTKEDSKESNTPNKNPSPARSPSNSFSYRPRPPEIKSPSLSQSFKYKSELESKEISRYKPSDCPKPTVSPSSFKSKSTFEDITKEAKNCGVVKPMQQKPVPIYNNTNVSKSKEKILINDKGQSVVTGQFHIPVISVKSPESPRPPTQTQVLSKSDSWHQICLAHQSTNEKPVPKPGPVKSKSSHSLSVPKMYEAGMSKEEMMQKRKTMEAFLTGNKSPPVDLKVKTVKRSINRIKTSEKRSTQTKVGGGLSRSRTLPDIICPDLLDENNVDKAFDELFQSS